MAKLFGVDFRDMSAWKKVEWEESAWKEIEWKRESGGKVGGR